MFERRPVLLPERHLEKETYHHAYSYIHPGLLMAIKFEDGSPGAL